MKKYLPFFLLFTLLLTGCGQARHSYTPAIITSSRLSVLSAPEQTENSTEKSSSAALSVLSEISSEAASVNSTASSKRSTVSSSKSAYSKVDPAVTSTFATASSKAVSSSRSSKVLSASSTTPTLPNSGDVEIVSLTSPIVRGQEASITIKGTPGVEYIIKVVYKSGPSSAKGLEPKNADSDGTVKWSWKVSSRTTSGSWSIEISGGGASVTAPFLVTE